MENKIYGKIIENKYIIILDMLSKMAKVEDDAKIPQKREYEKMKINELKQTLRNFGLKLSGNKPELLERIKTHIKQSEQIVKIQRVGRGYLARTWVKLKRGDKSSCVNDADFYTLEPINEIPFYYYVHYTEEKTKTSYVFNLMSLCTMISKSGKFENPYTRENMKTNYGSQLGRIVKLTIILFPENPIVEELKNICISEKIVQSTRMINPQPNPPINFDRRVTELFIAIDTLGNYTQKEWFLGLTNVQICNLVLRINTIWTTTTSELKQCISPAGSPFSIQNTGVERMSLNRTLDENRIVALRIAEVLVYSGINNEHKITGTMIFLTGLTTVSYAARLQMPWLYDNYQFLLSRL